MQRPTNTGPKTMFELTKGLIPASLVKTGQESLTRIAADMGKKEYPVFVEPIKRRLPPRVKYGFKRVLMPFSKLDGGAEAVETPETSEPTPVDLSPTEDSADAAANGKTADVVDMAGRKA